MSDSKKNLSIFLALCTLVLVLGGLRAATLGFWSDELATVHVAEAPSWADMMHRSWQADLNPPLGFALERLSFWALGNHEFAGRVPSLLGFALATGCLFLFLRRRTSLLFAVFGALLPLCNDEVSRYATEARPYALLLGWLAVALLAYDSILRERRPGLARAVLLAATAGMLLTHMFGLFAVAAFVFAEAIRSVRRQRLDILTFAALLLPLVCCLTYLPLVRGQTGGSPMVYELKDRASLRKGLLVFHTLLYVPIAPLVKITALLLIFGKTYPSRSFRESLQLPPEMVSLLVALLMTPLLLVLLFETRNPTGGFYLRYSIAVVLPAYVLLAGFAAWRSDESTTVATLLVAAVFAGIAANFADAPRDLRSVAHHGLLQEPEGLNSPGGVNTVYPELPLVINDAFTFFEADNRLPSQDLKRMVYVCDPAESMRLLHFNAKESIAGMAAAFHLRSRVVAYRPFIAAHPEFLVLSQPAHHDWFLDAMAERRANIRQLGTFRYAGKNQDLWLVSLQQLAP